MTVDKTFVQVVRFGMAPPCEVCGKPAPMQWPVIVEGVINGCLRKAGDLLDLCSWDGVYMCSEPDVPRKLGPAIERGSTD